MQAARADVFGRLIHLGGETRDFLQRVIGEIELDPLGFEQRRVLLGERVLRLFEDADKIVHGERFQFDPDRKPALQFGNQIAGLGHMERARGDEQNVIRTDEAVTGIDGGAFHDGQNIPLHAFAAHIGAVATFAAGDLVDLVEEHDAAGFHAFERDPRDLIHVDELLLFFLDQIIESVRHAHIAAFGALAEHGGKHLLDVHAHLFQVHVAGDFKRRAAVFHFQFDHALVEFAVAQAVAEFLAGFRIVVGAFGRGRNEQVEQAILGRGFRAIADFVQLFLPHHVDGNIDEIADDGFHVAADVSDLSELARFHLHERGVGEFGQTAGEFGFADAGGPDHQDIFGHHVFRHLGRKLLTPHAVAERNGHGALGVGLADDVLVEFANNLARRQFVQNGPPFDRLAGQIDHHVSPVPRWLRCRLYRYTFAPRSSYLHRRSDARKVSCGEAGRWKRTARRARPSRWPRYSRPVR